MQITIQFIKDELSLPIAVNGMIQGLLYKAISEDFSYSTEIHDNGRQFDGRKYKLFTFGEPKGKYEIRGKQIVYLGGMRISVRSVDSYFIQLLFTYFMKHNQVQIGENSVRVGDIQLSDDKIFEERVMIRTLSPIMAYITDESGHTVYYTPEDENFYNSIVTNAHRKWASTYGEEKDFSLKISRVENIKYIKRATRFKSTFITAWHGTFVLEGTPQVLDFLYQSGLGSKNSQGFGMFELKKEQES